MRVLRPRRRWIVVALVLVLLIAAIHLQDRAMAISYYRLVGEQTLVIGTLGGPGSWTRVTSVDETPSTVTITVSSLLAPLPSSAGGTFLEFVVTLPDPLGDRAVVDGTSGLTVPCTRCLPPTYSAPGCI